MKIFEQQPGFIDRDPRAAQADERAFTAESQQARYEAWIPPEFLKDASVLDLGCCCGAVGGYAFAHGAKRYVGVEISTALSKIAIQNFDEYHPDKDYWIEIKSAEDYLSTAVEEFDFVIIAGILHGITETVPFLAKAAELGKVIIVESVHPPLKVFDALVNKLIKDADEETRTELYQMMGSVEFVLPYAVYNDNGRMCLDDTHSTVTNIFRPLVSIGALKLIFNRLGFAEDIRPYKRLTEALPQYFGYGRRFGMAFIRRGAAKPMSFAELFVSDQKQVADWDGNSTEGMI